jgi:hypothetical protein
MTISQGSVIHFEQDKTRRLILSRQPSSTKARLPAIWAAI